MSFKDNVTILAIETSCDETAVAVIVGSDENTKILSNVVFSQIPLHRKFYGVYPELASRAHLEKILPVFEKALAESKTIIQDIDALAVTVGPGLIGSLLVGVNFAKTLSYVYQKPLIPVNHIEGHIYSNFVRECQNSNVKCQKMPQFPALCLIASGGHTIIVLMKEHLKYQILGETLDDAAGEAFDKVAKLLGLGYPGGPQIEQVAQEVKSQIPNSKSQIKLPRPMIETNDFNFSFSGLKTAVLQIVKRKKYSKAEIAFEFQNAVVDVLVAKTIKAARKFEVKSVILSGGVAANSRLRRELELKIKNAVPAGRQEKLKTAFFVPPKNLCTDNALGTAIAGYYKLLAKQVGKWYDVNANANLKLR